MVSIFNNRSIVIIIQTLVIHLPDWCQRSLHHSCRCRRRSVRRMTRKHRSSRLRDCRRRLVSRCSATIRRDPATADVMAVTSLRGGQRPIPCRKQDQQISVRAGGTWLANQHTLTAGGRKVASHLQQLRYTPWHREAEPIAAVLAD